MQTRTWRGIVGTMNNNRILGVRLALVAMLCVNLLTLSSVHAASAPARKPGAQKSPATTATAATAAAAPVSEDQRRLARLGPGDLVAVAVLGQPDMGSSEYVGDDGTLGMPLIGRVTVGGLSPVEASTVIENAFKAGRFLVDPHVTLTVTQSRSQMVSVLGEVRAPARYPVEPNTSIFDLLALAGGVTDDSADTVYIVRSANGGEAARTPVRLRGLAGNVGDALPNAKVRAGDLIFVPRAESFYIYGEVANPKKYRIEPDMTVIEAIATAGGLTPRGSERRVDIKRLGADGAYQTVHAKAGDPVRAGDVIRVKESIF